MFAVDSVAQLQDIVRQQSHVTVRAGGTKSALAQHANVDLSKWSGVVEYDPTEYTFTARAGTKLLEIEQLLATHRQFMPFDPVLVQAGGTIGGAIASGLSGSGRVRYGGVRDFLLGVSLVNGEGDVVRGGGKVVKNAAGFDIPKLVVGSLGRFGIVTEATFKVFPRPEAYATLAVEYAGPDALTLALEDMKRVAMSPAEAACLDLVPPQQLLIRVGGIATALPQRVDRLRKLVCGSVQVIEAEEDQRLWNAARELSWRATDQALVRVPIAPRDIVPLERLLAEAGVGPRRYSVGGHLLWLCWPETAGWLKLETLVQQVGRTAQVIIGRCERPLMPDVENAFGDRLLNVFDPYNKFSRLAPSDITGIAAH